MTYEQWQKVKEECHNEKMIAFAGLSKEAQKAILEARKSMESPIDWVNCDGSWEPIHISSFYCGNAYRINPSWPGPQILSCGEGFRWVEKGEALLDGDQFFSPQKEEWSWIIATINAKCRMNYTYRRQLTAKKPEPIVEYEDVPVYDHGGHLFYEPETELRERVSDATGRTDFAGYVMPDGRIRPRPIFDQQPDGTYRLRVPKAVRLVKNVEK